MTIIVKALFYILLGSTRVHIVCIWLCFFIQHIMIIILM